MIRPTNLAPILVVMAIPPAMSRPRRSEAKVFRPSLLQATRRTRACNFFAKECSATIPEGISEAHVFSQMDRAVHRCQSPRSCRFSLIWSEGGTGRGMDASEGAGPRFPVHQILAISTAARPQISSTPTRHSGENGHVCGIIFCAEGSELCLRLSTARFSGDTPESAARYLRDQEGRSRRARGWRVRGRARVAMAAQN